MFYFELLFLNNKPVSKFKPRACQKPIFISPKIAGISQFHSHITGNAPIIEAKINNANTDKIFNIFSTIFSF